MTLGELASDLSLELAVRAGAGGLDRPIRWVHATELIDPSRYLRGGELIHTVALWRRSPEDSERFVEALAAGGAAGICLGVGARDGMHAAAPPDLVAACERHDMPLLELRDTTPFVRISEVVIGAIMGARADGAERSLAREQRLVRAAAGTGALAAILAVLADELDCDCCALAPSGRTLATAGAEWTLDRRIALLAEAGRARHLPARSAGAIVFPVPVAAQGARPWGWLVVAESDALGEAGARTAIGQVVEFLALEFARLRDLRQREARYAGGLLDLIAGGRLGAEDAASALDDLGLDRKRPALAIAVTAPADDDAFDLLDAIAAAFDEAALVACARGGTVALFSCSEDEAAAHARVRSAVHRTAGILELADAAVGVGRVTTDPGDVRGPVAEALQALRATAADRSLPAVVTARELGRHALLLALQADDVRSAFQTSVLGPVCDYDARHRSDLLPTLDAFLASCGGWQRTADALHIHVNTLRYRLSRIEELTGRDLASMGDRVDFHLALRARELESEQAAGPRVVQA
jgi:sugar diacid utilization regulator